MLCPAKFDLKERRAMIDVESLELPKDHSGIFWRQLLLSPVIVEGAREDRVVFGPCKLLQRPDTELLHELFQQHPFLTANQLVEHTGLSAPTVNAALADLERFGILEEITGRKRGRVFSYRSYLTILSEGTDPLPTTT